MLAGDIRFAALIETDLSAGYLREARSEYLKCEGCTRARRHARFILENRLKDDIRARYDPTKRIHQCLDHRPNPFQLPAPS